MKKEEEEKIGGGGGVSGADGVSAGVVFSDVGSKSDGYLVCTEYSYLIDFRPDFATEVDCRYRAEEAVVGLIFHRFSVIFQGFSAEFFFFYDFFFLVFRVLRPLIRLFFFSSFT